MGDLVIPCFAVLLAVDTDHLVDMTLNVGLKMRQTAGDLVLREIPVAIVHGLELAAVDGNAIAPQHPDPSAQLHELRAGPADRRSVISPEIGDGLVVWHQATGQPHQLDIASRLTLQATAGRDAVQITVDEELQQHSRMVARATGSGGHTTLEAERRKIKLLDKEVDDTDQVILADPVLETIRKKRDLFPVDAIDETRHPCLPLPCESLPRNSVSTQPRPIAAVRPACCDWPFCAWRACPNRNRRLSKPLTLLMSE